MEPKVLGRNESQKCTGEKVIDRTSSGPPSTLLVLTTAILQQMKQYKTQKRSSYHHENSKEGILLQHQRLQWLTVL